MKTLTFARCAIAAAALAAFTPVAASAQDNSTTGTGSDTGYTTRAQDDDDNDFPWGLLGLLGLAGLAGLKRKDNDIHVDARRNS